MGVNTEQRVRAAAVKLFADKGFHGATCSPTPPGPRRPRVVDHGIHVLSPDARREIVLRRNEYERLWVETMDGGISSGAIQDGRPALTRLALLEMCNGVFNRYSRSGPLSLEELATHYARLAIRMLGGVGNDFSTAMGLARSVVSTVWQGTL